MTSKGDQSVRTMVKRTAILPAARCHAREREHAERAAVAERVTLGEFIRRSVAARVLDLHRGGAR